MKKLSEEIGERGERLILSSSWEATGQVEEKTSFFQYPKPAG